jgi:hypothetical protein
MVVKDPTSINVVAGEGASPVSADDVPPTGVAPGVGLPEAEHFAMLGRQLESLRVRFAVTRQVVMDMSRWVDDDQEAVDLVVDDVLRRWSERDRSDESAEIVGPNSFCNQYAHRVEFAPPDSGDQLRAEFCPPEGEPFNAVHYYSSVWRAHVADLRAAATTRTRRSG